MRHRLLLAAALVAAAPICAGAQQGTEQLTVSQSFQLSDGASGMTGRHTLVFPAPEPGQLAALPVGGAIMLKAISVSGSTSAHVDGSDDYYDSRSRRRRPCPGTYAADLRAEPNRTPVLWITRTSAGLELSTLAWSEYLVAPFEACAGEISGACQLAWETPLVFRVPAAAAGGLDQVHGTARAELTWTEEHSCGGTIAAALNGTLPSDDEVALEGPSCACAERPVAFTASARRGGSFERWDVQASGEAPRVVQRSGGAAPRLVLSGEGERTGTARVTAVYRRQGRELRSEPKQVHFCRVGKPELQAGPAVRNRKDYQYDQGSTGTVEIPVEGRAWLDGQEASDRLRWRGQTHDGRELLPDSAQARRVKLEGRGLPEANSGFGPARIESRLAEAGCDCRSEPVEARLFFPRDSRNNPGGALPNWAYYWRQTRAGRDASGSPIPHKVVSLIPVTAGTGGNSATVSRFDPYNDVIYVGENLIAKGSGLKQLGSGCCARRDSSLSVGIDCFGEALWHELAHRTELYHWWGERMARYPCADSVVCLVDRNLDWVPDEENCGGPRADPQACGAMPTWCGSVNDLEMHAYDEGWKWPQGSARDEDWAAPGSQWKEEN